MPWNREKILAELDRKRIPRGVVDALLERPDLGTENLCYALEHGGSSRLHSNCLFMLPQLLLKRFIQQSHVDQSLTNIRAHMSSADESVRYSACRAAVIFASFARSYPHLNLGWSERCSLVESAVSKCPQLADELAIQIRIAQEPRDTEEERE